MKINRSFTEVALPASLLAVAQDEHLSYAARGLLTEILTHGDEWDINAISLARRAKDARGNAGEGRDTMRGLFNELKEHGYLVRDRFRAGRGQFGTTLDMFDAPQVPGSQPVSAPLSQVATGITDVVYVIGQQGSSVVKIGTTSNLETRLKSIQTGSPVSLEVLWSRSADWRLEHFLHGVFHDMRLEGEWFDFEDADPVAEVAQAAGRFYSKSI